jgi:hypothetical protein
MVYRYLGSKLATETCEVLCSLPQSPGFITIAELCEELQLTKEEIRKARRQIMDFGVNLISRYDRDLKETCLSVTVKDWEYVKQVGNNYWQTTNKR